MLKGLKVRKLKSLTAVGLSVFLALQGGVLTAGAAVLPENGRYAPNDSSEYSISVTPETARYYLEQIERVERSAKSQGYNLGSSSFIASCIDIDQNGSDELLTYDTSNEGGIYFNIYSSEGEICSEWIDTWHCFNLIPYFAIAEPYVIGTTCEYENENFVTLYKMENGYLKKIEERFISAHPSGDGASYTDANGNIIEDIGGINSDKSIPKYDLLAQILDEAKQLGVNIDQGFIIKESDCWQNDVEVMINGEKCYLFDDSRINTELIKKELQHIIDAGNRGENIVQPTDSIYRDIVDTLMAWNVAFAQGDFDLTLGEFPVSHYVFDWFEEEFGTEVISLDTEEKRKKFLENISPVFEEELLKFYDYANAYANVTKLDKSIINQYLYALYGNNFDVEKYYNTKKEGSNELALSKDGQLYTWLEMGTGGGIQFDVTAISDVGDGFYLAHLNDYSEYGGMEIFDESHVLLRKAPEDAELKYHIVKCSTGTLDMLGIQATKSRLMEANTKYDYEKIARFTEKQQYVDYLEEQFRGLNGSPINDKGKKETIAYIQYLYENAVISDLAAKGNKIVLNRENLEKATADLQEVINQTKAILDKYQVSLNKELFATVRCNASGIKENKKIDVEVHADAMDVLKDFTSIRVAFNEQGKGFGIKTENLQALLGGAAVARFAINQDGASHALVFQDENKKELSKSGAPITLYLPAETPYASVEAQYGDHLDNWGGQYDETAGLIFFDTEYSGIYTVVENEIQISDIGNLTEEQQKMIRFMVSKGFFSAENGIFAPDKTLSRYDFATALVGMFYAMDHNAACSFDDVPKESKYYPYVASAEQSKIAAGIGNNKFSGDRLVTKEEVVAFCTRTLVDQKGYQIPEDISQYANFTDRDQIGKWALPEIALAEQVGLITGGGTFSPKGQITRAESAEILYQLFMMLYEVSPAKAQLYESAAGGDFPVVPVAVAGIGAAGVGAYFYTNKNKAKK